MKGTVLLVVGGYIGAGGLRTKSYEASQLRRSMNPSDLKYNVDLLIRVYTSIRGEYSDTAPVPKACDAQHTSRHFLHTREGRKGFRSEHRK